MDVSTKEVSSIAEDTMFLSAEESSAESIRDGLLRESIKDLKEQVSNLNDNITKENCDRVCLSCYKLGILLRYNMMDIQEVVFHNNVSKYMTHKHSITFCLDEIEEDTNRIEWLFEGFEGIYRNISIYNSFLRGILIEIHILKKFLIYV